MAGYAGLLDKKASESSAAHGHGTPVAEYMAPESGPFKCGHCEHMVEPGRCNQREVVSDPDLKKIRGLAVIEDGGCCRFFELRK